MNNELLKALGRCGVITEADIQFHFELTLDEINKLVKDKVLEQGIREDKVIYLTLTDKGEKILLKNNPEFGEIYRGFIINHDLVLMEFYLKRTSFEKDNWFTRDDLIKEFKLPGIIDASYVSESGKVEGVEVMKNTSKFADVEKKESFVSQSKIQGMTYLMYKD